ncbi:MAG: MFS family permease [Gammaproteobacteria bacterium]|jgi:MFS family permease
MVARPTKAALAYYPFILLFIVVSILISFPLVPMLVSSSAIPPYELPERISFTKLFRLSPMGLTGSFLNGISQAALYVALVLYGNAVRLSSSAIGGLMGSLTIGGMLFQFPLGKLSDRFDRRLIIVCAPGLSIPLCLGLAMLNNPADNLLLLYLLVALLGGLTLPIYSICMAHINDHLKPSQVIAASGTLVLILASGMILGPSLGGFVIDHDGANGIFYLLSVTAGLTVMTAPFRFWSGAAVRDEDRGKAVAVPSSLTPVATVLYAPASDHGEIK